MPLPTFAPRLYPGHTNGRFQVSPVHLSARYVKRRWACHEWHQIDMSVGAMRGGGIKLIVIQVGVKCEKVREGRRTGERIGQRKRGLHVQPPIYSPFTGGTFSPLGIRNTCSYCPSPTLTDHQESPCLLCRMACCPLTRIQVGRPMSSIVGLHG